MTLARIRGGAVKNLHPALVLTGGDGPHSQLATIQSALSLSQAFVFLSKAICDHSC